MPEQQIVDVTFPMLEDDLWIANRVAERLGVSVPQAMSLAVRLLAECEAQGVLQQDGKRNLVVALQPGMFVGAPFVRPDWWRTVYF